jgi:hypothetical protein
MLDSASPSGIAMTWRIPVLESPAIRRLIVLLPNADINEASLAQALWTLADGNGVAVHIIAMMDDWAAAGQIRLRLALLTAFLRESGIEPSVVLEETTTDWVQITRREYRPGDAIVCHAEQRMPTGTRRLAIEFSPLSQYLLALHMPVYELRNALRCSPQMTFTRALRLWVLPILIIVGSLILEVAFMSWARAWAEWLRHLVLIVYTALEIVSIAWLAKSLA